MIRNATRKTLAAAAMLLILPTLTGCKPDNVFLSIKNGSGGTLRHVKLTYPGGKLTFVSLDTSTIIGTYRHFDGPGDLAVSYATEDGRTYSSSGPQVTGNEKGNVEVSIDGSYASFDTKFEENRQ